MNVDNPAAVLFEMESAHLRSLAYRMLGTVDEAEDVVQEAWIRLQREDFSLLRNPAAWLTTVTSRLALDRLNSAQSRRETYVGPWLPEPSSVDPLLAQSIDPAEQVVLAESVSIGFLSILERLSATERAVFLLREVFEVPMAEVAKIIEKAEPATRQIAKRARDRIQAERPRFRPTPDDVDALVEAFLVTLASGDLEAFEALLVSDVVSISDGGANYRAARVPVVGSDRVARFYTNLIKRAQADNEVHYIKVGGQPALYVTKARDELDTRVDSEHSGAARNRIDTAGSDLSEQMRRRQLEPYLLLVINWSEGKVDSLLAILNVEKLVRVHEAWIQGDLNLEVR